MIVNPIIPIWLMTIICVILLVIKRKVAVLLLFAINLRIMVPDDTIEYNNVELNTKVIFVMDNTISMLANDYKGEENRLSAAKKDCKDIIDKLAGSKFSIISFDNSAHVVSPFSQDEQFAEMSIDSISPLYSYYATGSSMNLWHDITLEQLKKAKEQNNGDVVVFFISDGENNSPDKLQSFKDMAKYIDNGAVLGYGTKEGGTMTVSNIDGDQKETIEDPEDYNKSAVSRIDEDNLNQIAQDLGVKYINMNQKKGIDKLVNEVLSNASTSDSNKKATGHKDIYYIFLVPFIMLSVYDFIKFKRKK